MTDQSLDQEQTSKVLRFLGEFDRIRQAPIRHLARYEYSRLHRLFPIGPGCECSLDAFADSEAGDSPPGKVHETVILRVSKPETASPPAMPSQFAPWIRTYPNDPDKPPKPESVRVDRAPMTPPNPADRFDGDPERPKAFQSWIRITWDPWASSERLPRAVLKFYEDLFARYLQVQRDGGSDCCAGG